MTETLSEWIKIPEKMIMVKEATLSALRSEAANCVLADTPLKTWTTVEVILIMLMTLPRVSHRVMVVDSYPRGWRPYLERTALIFVAF